MALASGCGAPEEPSPRPLAVTPDRGAASVAVPVVIAGTDFAADVQTDFEGRDPSTLDARFQAFLGATALRDVQLRADGSLTATVPAGIPAGLHDLEVVGPTGREGALAGAYRALTDAETVQLVASYRMEPIGPQQAWTPFSVTIEALDAAGAVVAGFAGTVTLSDLTGTVVPGSPALFRDGRWTGAIEIRAPHAADVLTVGDPLGNVGASAPFAVAPTPPAALRFATPARSTVAGDCSGASQPLTVELVDAFGLPTVSTGALTITPTAAAGLGIFEDDACAVPASGPTLAAGTGALTVWFRSTQAGAVTVELSAPSLAAAAQDQSVLAGPPATVAFVSGAQTLAAGSCSLATTVEVRDAWGNPATGAGVSVALGAAPAAGFELFSDAACSTTATGVTTAPATAQADFWFRGTTAQPVSVTASGATLAADTQVETITSQASASRLAFVTPPRTTVAGSCSGDVTLQAQDAFGNPVSGAAPVAVALAATPGGGFAFYADAACAVPLGGAASIPASASEVTLHVRGTIAGAESLDATAAGLAGAAQAATVLPAAPHHLAFTSTAQTQMAGSCSSPADLELRDPFDNVSTATGPTLVSLAATPSSGFAFYADAACASPISTASIAAGGSAATFHFRATETGAFTADATSAGLVGASQVETITPAVADRIVFTSAPQTVGAGTCSAVATVQSMDPLGNVSPVSASTTVALAATPSAGFTFFSDAACTSPVAAVTIPASGSQASFWFRGDTAGTVTLDATPAGLTAAAQAETIVPAAPDRLVFTTAPQTVAAGACSSVATVQSMDPLGNVSPVPAASPVDLTAIPAAGFTFFSDATCTSPASAVAIPAGGSQASFWFRGDAAGSVTVDAASVGLLGASQIETITPAPADRIVFTTAPQTVGAGSCGSVATVQSMDPLGNVSPVPAASSVDLTATPSTGFTFFSDAACTSPASAVTIPAGGSQASFWFRGDAAGSVTVDATPVGLLGASQIETIDPAPADRLVFLTPPRTSVAGECSAPLTVQTQDPYGNPVVAPSSLPLSVSGLPAATTVFYADAACALPLAAGEPAIAAGSSSATFHFVATAAGALEVTVAAAGLTSAVQDHSILAAAPAGLAFASAPQSVTAGTCSAAADLELRDAFGNPALAIAAVDVAMAATPAGGLAFYGDAGCVTPIASVPIAAGAGAATFFFRGATVGSVVADATASGLTGASQVETITPAAATRLAFTTPTQSVPAGACAAATVETKDAFDNTAPVGALTVLDLSPAPGATFALYADATCAAGTETTAATIGAGAAAATFYFLGTAVESRTVTAADAAALLAADSQIETIGPAPASRLVFTTPSQSVVAGDCGAATVETRDAFGNASPVAWPTALDLGPAPGATFALYDDATCAPGTEVTGTAIAAGAGAATFHFRGTQVGDVTVTATDVAALLAPGAQVETIGPAAATRFAWDAVATPAAADWPFDVRITALDPFDNVATGFTGSADLSLVVDPPTGPAPLTCVTGCTGLTTAPFSAGVWSGVVAVGEPESPSLATPDRRLVASGTLVGVSNDFAVYGVPDRSPPTACLTATPAAVLRDAPILLDASCSSDYQTPAADLLVSWDLSGTATAAPAWPTPAAPWTAWTTLKSATTSFGNWGTYPVRVAVRDADGDVAFGVVSVRVRGQANLICWVETDADTDDGPSSCGDAANHGDRLLSLREAVRVAPAGNVIAFRDSALPMTIVKNPSLGALSITDQVEIRGPGVVLDGLSLDINAGTSNSPVVVVGLELAGQAAASVVREGHTATFEDVRIHDGPGIVSYGSVLLDRSRMTNCSGACVTMLDTSGGDTLTVRYSELTGSGTGIALDIADCAVTDTALVARSSLFRGFQEAIHVGCAGATTVQHDTFEANGTGIVYASGGTAHTLHASVFSNQATAAVSLGSASFGGGRDYHLLWQNASDGGLDGDANALAADPLYLFPAQGDFRPSLGSPAVDSAPDLGLSLIPAFPSSAPLCLGLPPLPDRGAYETW